MNPNRFIHHGFGREDRYRKLLILEGSAERGYNGCYDKPGSADHETKVNSLVPGLMYWKKLLR